MKNFLLGLIFLLITRTALSCSMFKVTLNGKTMVGNNEDSWRLTSRIWFEKGTDGNYGVAYVGYSDKNFADGAVNEAGLVFDGFSVMKRKMKESGDKKENIGFWEMNKVMQSCETVDEVHAMLDSFNLNWFNGAMMLFVDKTGKYLVVEGDTMTFGNDPKYVLANFCPSQTPDLNEVKIARYKRGRKFLENKIDTSLAFCAAMMDTMHECRAKAGDGTLYTTIYDLNAGLIYLYFFHDFSHPIEFNLKAEFEKENHTFEIPALFPQNEEYKKFSRYITPQNNRGMQAFFLGCGALYFFSFFYFLVGYFRAKKKFSDTSGTYTGIRLGLAIFSGIMLYFLFVLETNQAMFYYPAPYKDVQFSMVNIAAFTPFTLLFLIIPLLLSNVKVFRSPNWKTFGKGLFAVNCVSWLVFTGWFAYWGFYDVW